MVSLVKFIINIQKQKVNIKGAAFAKSYSLLQCKYIPTFETQENEIMVCERKSNQPTTT